MRSHMRRKAHRLSGHGANISTVVSDSALVSANLTRTPSMTRKYVVICEAELTRGVLLDSLSDRSGWRTRQPVCPVKGSLPQRATDTERLRSESVRSERVAAAPVLTALVRPRSSRIYLFRQTCLYG